MKSKSARQKAAASILAAAIAFAGVQSVWGKNTVNAASKKDQTNTCLGTSKIPAPLAPGSKDTEWKGNYVHLGYYSGNSMYFRVLSPSTNVYGGKTMFLDCNRPILEKSFDDSSNDWANSDIRSFLNSTFLTSAFTVNEQKAIATSTGNGKLAYDSFGTYYFGSPVSVDDKIFLLDASEVRNPKYGYTSDSGYTDNDDDWSTGFWDCYTVPNRVKRGSTTDLWLLRSANPSDTGMNGSVGIDGTLNWEHESKTTGGIAPALNIDLDNIIFSTAIDGNMGATYGTYYKLTLLDENIKLSLKNGGSAILSGTKVTLPCSVEGGSANRISVLILDKEYKNATEIKYYDALNDAHEFDFSATGLDIAGWGTDYFVYVVAEEVNNDPKTDYACIPIKVSAPSATTGTTHTIDVNIRTVDSDGVTTIAENGGAASANATNALSGETITVSVTPNSGYTLKSIEWGNGAASTDITTAKSFVMEDYNVAVDVTFQKDAGTGTGTGTGTATTPPTADPTTTGTGTGTAATTTTDPATTSTGTGTGTGAAATTTSPAGSESTVTAAAPNTYTVVKGADGSWDGVNDYVIEIKSSSDDEHCIDRFSAVSDNGKNLAVGTDCLVTKGSTVITIKSSYLKSLSTGSHKIVVTFVDNTVSTTLTIKEAANTAKTTVPKTGEVQSTSSCLGMFMLVLAGGIVSVIAIRKKREND